MRRASGEPYQHAVFTGHAQCITGSRGWSIAEAQFLVLPASLAIPVLRLSPTPDNCDSILTDGVVTQLGGSFRLGLSFIGGPIIGPPNNWAEISTNDSSEAPDIEVIAQSMAWRRLARGVGPGRHYRPNDGSGGTVTGA